MARCCCFSVTADSLHSMAGLVVSFFLFFFIVIGDSSHSMAGLVVRCCCIFIVIGDSS